MRPMRAHRVASILLILAPLLFSLAGPPPDATAQSAPGSGRKVIVHNGDQQLASELAGRGGTVLVDYGAFSLWSVPDPVADSLKGRASATIHEDFDTIPLRGGNTIDTRGSGPSVPSGLRQTRSSGAQMWLVQFVGPI